MQQSFDHGLEDHGLEIEVRSFSCPTHPLRTGVTEVPALRLAHAHLKHLSVATGTGHERGRHRPADDVVAQIRCGGDRPGRRVPIDRGQREVRRGSVAWGTCVHVP